MGDSPTLRLLRRLHEGDSAAAQELLPLIYDELHGVARRIMGGERRNHTLQPTALIHEAWIRLNGADIPYENREHFVGVAARAMRQVLVDHARAKRADKRGGDRAAVPLDSVLALYEERPIDVVALDEALDNLAARDTEAARIVELRYFAGLTLEETAATLALTVRQVTRRWAFARGWLRRELERGEAAGE